MSNTVTLDSLRAAADAKYGSYDIAIDEKNTVRLLNPLRLPEERRELLIETQRAWADSEDESTAKDQRIRFETTIRMVAETDGQADRLIAAVDGDLAVLADIVGNYSKGTQLGEASASVD